MAGYKLTLIKYPSGRFGWVGSVPVVLCNPEKNYNSIAYETITDAVKDATNKGITDYDLPKILV